MTKQPRPAWEKLWLPTDSVLESVITDNTGLSGLRPSYKQMKEGTSVWPLLDSLMYTEYKQEVRVWPSRAYVATKKKKPTVFAFDAVHYQDPYLEPEGSRGRREEQHLEPELNSKIEVSLCDETLSWLCI